MTYLLQITPEELRSIVQSEVAAEMRALKQQVEAAKELPVRLTCVGAAKVLGVSAVNLLAVKNNLKKSSQNACVL